MAARPAMLAEPAILFLLLMFLHLILSVFYRRLISVSFHFTQFQLAEFQFAEFQYRLPLGARLEIWLGLGLGSGMAIDRDRLRFEIRLVKIRRVEIRRRNEKEPNLGG